MRRHEEAFRMHCRKQSATQLGHCLRTSRPLSNHQVTHRAAKPHTRGHHQAPGRFPPSFPSAPRRMRHDGGWPQERGKGKAGAGGAAAPARAVPGQRSRARPSRLRAAGHGEQGAAAAPADRHQPQEDEAAHGARLRRVRRL